jgi:hypothetical protein
MRTTCTIYWNAHNHTYHELLCAVSEGLEGEKTVGSHTVLTSNVYDVLLSATWTKKCAEKKYGADNVRFYDIKEVKV